MATPGANPAGAAAAEVRAEAPAEGGVAASGEGSAEASAEGGAEAAAGLCKDCTEGFLWTGEPAGEESPLGELPAYVARPPADSAIATSAILFIADAFGWKFNNNRLLCDRLASSTGCHVYMPDLFDGVVPVTEDMAKTIFDPQPSLVAKVTSGLRMFVAVPSMIMTLQKFGAAVTQPKLDKVVEAVRQLHGGEQCKLGAVGYCWGGKYSLRLGAQGKVAASVACHPSLVDPAADELSKMSAACLFIRSEHDFVFGEKLWKQTEEAIKGAGATLDFTVYPGTKHGFAVRCSEGDEVALKARDEAFARTADWFLKYLK